MSYVTESQSNKWRHAIQLVVNGETNCYVVRDCFPSLVPTFESDDCHFEALGQLNHLTESYMDGMFVVGSTQRAGAIKRKIQRVFAEQKIVEGWPRLMQQEPNGDGCFNSRIYLDNGGKEHDLLHRRMCARSLHIPHCDVRVPIRRMTVAVIVADHRSSPIDADDGR
jgi:hypothetical protein